MVGDMESIRVYIHTEICTGQIEVDESHFNIFAKICSISITIDYSPCKQINAFLFGNY